MTDITELAQLRAELSNPANGSKDHLRKLALLLVEALEKAQRANAAQDDHINQQQDRIDQLEKGHQEAAKQINSWRRMAKQNIAEREKDIAELDAVRQRIAELESRTVKLPEPYAYLRENDGQIQISIGAERPSDRSGGYSTPWFAIYTAAGLKVKAE